MHKKLTLPIFGFILFLTILTRGYLLGSVPSGLYVDEAAQGYSAYSIAKTGRDEFGKPYPMLFRSFTDFKTPVYTYFIVPLIYLFGLNPVTVRLPSFIFSILTIPVFYFLIKELVSNQEKKDQGFSNFLPLVACLLLAISPWHILFGRTNYEATVALSLFLTGTLFLYKGLKSPVNYILSATLFALSGLAYHAERVIVPLFLIIFFLRLKKSLLKEDVKKYIFLASFVFFIILFPTLVIAGTPGFSARASGLTILSYVTQMPYGVIENILGIKNFVFNNLLFLSMREFLSLYSFYFSPRSMFVLGDGNLQSSYPSLSTFFVWQFPFYLVGLWFLLKKGKYKELRTFTVILLILSPLPAAFTRDPYTTVRALPLVIPQIFIIAIGIIESYNYLVSRVIYPRFIFVITFFFLIIYSLAKLYSSIVILNEYYRAPLWNYGWNETVSILNTIDPNVPVVVDTARGEPYIQIAFFTQYSPEKYSESNFEVTNEEYYYKMTRRSDWIIGNISVKPLVWEEVLLKEQYLVGDALAISDEQIKIHNLILVHDTLYPDGTIAQRIVKTSL